MVKKTICGLVALGSFGLLLLGADDAFVGTWKLNEAKSKFAKGQEVKVSTVVVTREGDTIAVTFNGTDNAGKTVAGKYTVPSGGGTLTYTEGAPVGGLDEELKRVDDRTIDVLYSKNGKVLVTDHLTVAANHKTMIGRVSGVDENGKPFKNVEVYERQ